MAGKVNMTLRMEPELKEQATELFQNLGLDLSSATRIFYKQALRCNGIPFAITLEEPNEVTYAAIQTAEDETDLYGPFDNITDLMEALNA